jgi:hypothetical protein
MFLNALSQFGYQTGQVLRLKILEKFNYKTSKIILFYRENSTDGSFRLSLVCGIVAPLEK